MGSNYDHVGQLGENPDLMKLRQENSNLEKEKKKETDLRIEAEGLLNILRQNIAELQERNYLLEADAATTLAEKNYGANKLVEEKEKEIKYLQSKMSFLENVAQTAQRQSANSEQKIQKLRRALTQKASQASSWSSMSVGIQTCMDHSPVILSHKEECIKENRELLFLLTSTYSRSLLTLLRPHAIHLSPSVPERSSYHNLSSSSPIAHPTSFSFSCGIPAQPSIIDRDNPQEVESLLSSFALNFYKVVADMISGSSTCLEFLPVLNDVLFAENYVEMDYLKTLYQFMLEMCSYSNRFLAILTQSEEEKTPEERRIVNGVLRKRTRKTVHREVNPQYKSLSKVLVAETLELLSKRKEHEELVGIILRVLQFIIQETSIPQLFPTFKPFFDKNMITDLMNPIYSIERRRMYIKNLYLLLRNEEFYDVFREIQQSTLLLRHLSMSLGVSSSSASTETYLFKLEVIDFMSLIATRYGTSGAEFILQTSSDEEERNNILYYLVLLLDQQSIQGGSGSPLMSPPQKGVLVSLLDKAFLLFCILIPRLNRLTDLGNCVHNLKSVLLWITDAYQGEEFVDRQYLRKWAKVVERERSLTDSDSKI